MAMRPNGASTSRAIATREPGRVKRTTGHQSATSSPMPPSHSAPETRCSQSLRMLGTRGSAEPACPEAATAPSASTTAPAAARGRRSRSSAAATSATTTSARPAPARLPAR